MSSHSTHYGSHDESIQGINGDDNGDDNGDVDDDDENNNNHDDMDGIVCHDHKQYEHIFGSIHF